MTPKEMQDEAIKMGSSMAQLAKNTWVVVTAEGNWYFKSSDGTMEKIPEKHGADLVLCSQRYVRGAKTMVDKS